VQRAARAFGFALGVERIGDRQGIGIELDYGIQMWAASTVILVDLIDSREVFFGECSSGELT